VNTVILKLAKEIQFNSPMRRYFFPRYGYNFTPPQLNFLCRCIEDSKHSEGAVCEIGCAYGYTTLFLNKYMDAEGIEKPYYAIDTFSGFVSDDVEFEVNHRRKKRGWYSGFAVNKKKWFDATMQSNKIVRVTSIQADVNKMDLTKIGSLSFCLLDVDLYRPMRKALPELYSVLSPGGIIVVDDCNSASELFDGSDQAYNEFMQEMGQKPTVVHGKLGIIKKLL